MTLDELGWSPALDAAFRDHATAGLVPARVAVAYGATFRVVGPDRDELADITGRLRHEAQSRRDLPAVGDWVVVKATTIKGGRSTIHAVLPRKSLFSRKVAGQETVEQIVATNVDTAFLVTALDRDFNVRRLERYLAMTWESGARPVILLNKADLGDEGEMRRQEAERAGLAVPVHLISARNATGLDALAPYLHPGQTIAVLGSSGVGKSTLINRLLGEERLATREVRESDHRGRHTTTHRELIPLPGGALLIDTPGMRELQLWTADAGVAEAFDDISTLAAGCYFADCQHDTEPKCAVKTAVENGTLTPERLESFHKLRREQAHLERQQDALAQQAEKKRIRTTMRSVRKLYQSKDRT
jgi:ribosome biogenesis GTPase / thiamine phosphate phosphatase